MKLKQLFSGDIYPPGRCIACDVVLVNPPGKTGAKRSVTCGAKECRREYHRLRDMRMTELALLGLEVERSRKENA